ncbi:MAG: hypothetical protein R3331_09255 [Sulfurospirillaceae bacterium]|nr:hypothetical protein [Sulfurospirillaceae bacterium]
MNCFVCGNPIISNGKGYRCSLGRPKNYCSDTCKDFQKYFNAMQKKLSEINLDDVHKRLIRGELFRVANSLKLSVPGNIGTKKPRDNNEF